MSIRELEKRSDEQTRQIVGMTARLHDFLDQLAGPAPSKPKDATREIGDKPGSNFINEMNASFNIRDAAICDLSDQIIRCEQLMGTNQPAQQGSQGGNYVQR